MDVSQNGVYHGMPSIMATYNRNDDDKRFSDPNVIQVPAAIIDPELAFQPTAGWLLARLGLSATAWEGHGSGRSKHK